MESVKFNRAGNAYKTIETTAKGFKAPRPSMIKNVAKSTPRAAGTAVAMYGAYKAGQAVGKSISKTNVGKKITSAVNEPFAKVNRWVQDIKTEYSRGQMIKKTAKRQADAEFKTKTGMAMTGSTYNDMKRGVMADKRVTAYDKDVKTKEKTLKNKMQAKGMYKGVAKAILGK